MADFTKNGYHKRILKKAKGPYRKTDINWWNKAGKDLVEGTSFKWTKKWKWLR